MKKIIVFCLFINLFAVSLKAQHTQIFTNPDARFNHGKELFSEHKFAASYRSFEDFLKSPDQNQVGQIQEAEYYLAANAYELRQQDAAALLKNHLQLYPYTPFSDQINDMLGMLEFEKKDYKAALVYFSQVDVDHLGETETVEFLFSKGYANLQNSCTKRQIYVRRKVLFHG